jgi:hypothetical protein
MIRAGATAADPLTAADRDIVAKQLESCIAAARDFQGPIRNEADVSKYLAAVFALLDLEQIRTPQPIPRIKASLRYRHEGASSPLASWPGFGPAVGPFSFPGP